MTCRHTGLIDSVFDRGITSGISYRATTTDKSAPERKLSMYEYYKRTLRVRDQIIQAFERDPALKANVERILGVNDVSESSSLGRQDLMILTCLMEIARAVGSN